MSDRKPRRAIAAPPADEVAAVKSKSDDDDVDKIDSGSLSGGGKLNPQQGLPGGSGLVVLPPQKEDDEDEEKSKIPLVTETYATKLFVPIMKANKERKTITGVALEPDTVDAHKDTIPANVILDAAEDFLANINLKTTMGLMHKDLNPPLELVQSFVVSDSDITINNVIVKRGSWVVTVRVNSDDIWQQIKDGKLNGFSIGGTAKVQSLKPKAVA